MGDTASYGSWQGVEQAMKSAATAAATSGGAGVNELLVRARFDRFLSRVFAQGEESGWLLKGGTGILSWE